MSKEEFDIDALHVTHSKKGKRLTTDIPNLVLMSMLGMNMGVVEMRIIIFIASTSYGIRNREETVYLSTEDFRKVIKIQESHLSKYIREMLKGQIILRSMKRGDKHKYAINLLNWGYTMKNYKKVDKSYKLCNSEYTFDDKSLTFCNKSVTKDGTVVYNSNG